MCTITVTSEKTRHILTRDRTFQTLSFINYDQIKRVRRQIKRVRSRIKRACLPIKRVRPQIKRVHRQIKSAA